MPLEPQYLEAIKRREGYTPRAAWDYKQDSVGYGTRARYPGEVIDKDEAERRLAAELTSARSIVDKFAPNVDPGTRAALTSLTYNAGDTWTRSGLGQAIQSGDLDTARKLFVQYTKAGGEELPGLVKRRAEEVQWFGSGAPTAVAGVPTQAAGGQTEAGAPKMAPAPSAAPAADFGAMPEQIRAALAQYVAAPDRPAAGQRPDGVQPVVDDGTDIISQMRFPQPARMAIARAAARRGRA